MTKVVADTAVAAALPIAGTIVLTEQTGISLVAGLAGVVLSRMIFVERENKRLKRRLPIRETLPLTLLATLITAVVIVDRGFGLSLSAFTGIGVGWTAIVLLDIIGEYILNILTPKQVKMTSMEDLRNLPSDMTSQLDALDAITRDEKA